jgi:hypothetical protein
MTVQQDVQRAGLRVMMAQPMLAVPEYSADPEVLMRVGDVIGNTASHEERHVRESDGLSRSTSKVAVSSNQSHSGPSIGLWAVSMGTSFCTVGLLGALAYWHWHL